MLSDDRWLTVQFQKANDEERPNAQREDELQYRLGIRHYEMEQRRRQRLQATNFCKRNDQIFNAINDDN